MLKTFVISALFIIFSLPIFGQEYTIKFATLAPEGSTWLNVMREYDQAIRKESGGRMGFKIYAGSVAGDEQDVLRKIRLGQYHSAGFTGVGMGKIAPMVRILDAPFFFKNHDEVDYVLAKYDSVFRKAFEDNGFVLLGWAEVGYVYVFTNKPITKVSDLDGVKMWMWEGDPVAEATFQALDVKPIPLSITDVLTSLQTGLVNGIYASPLAAVSLQWFTAVKYMMDVPLTNSAGAVLISKREYESLPADLQEILSRNGSIYMKKLTQLSRQDNDKSLQVLKKNKIIFTQPASQQEYERYEEIGKKARALMAGKLYSQEFLNSVERTLADYRASHKGSR
ncbi:MAG TPA: TRAP transporter substrate-binding protein DctP [Bacteroidota bacterium]|nr:TRAP transporter substrate-binding protein DctP [Bacteroidota bacterium]